jgi:hypothetical protein
MPSFIVAALFDPFVVLLSQYSADQSDQRGEPSRFRIAMRAAVQLLVLCVQQTRPRRVQDAASTRPGCYSPGALGRGEFCSTRAGSLCDRSDVSALRRDDRLATLRLGTGHLPR